MIIPSKRYLVKVGGGGLFIIKKTCSPHRVQTRCPIVTLQLDHILCAHSLLSTVIRLDKVEQWQCTRLPPLRSAGSNPGPKARKIA